MIKHLLLSVALCWITAAFAQTVRLPISVAYTGIGAYSNKHIDAFSLSANPASIAGIKFASAGLYGEKRFLQQELSFYNAAAVIPTTSGNFGIDTRYFGFAAYNETQAGLTYARNLGRAAIGIQFNYYKLSVAGYGNAGTVNVSAGAVFHLTDQLNAGFCLYNPFGGSLGKNDEEKLASLYTAGFGYEVSDLVFLSLAMEKAENQPLNVKAGILYQVLPQLQARIGMNTASSSFFTGAGFTFSNFRIDATANYHPLLGVYPGILLQYDFKKTE